MAIDAGLFGKFEQAIAWFLQRTVISSADYSALLASAKGRAFSYAGHASLSMVQHVFDLIRESLANGSTYGEFRKHAIPIMRNGWSLRGKAEGARIQLIFRNASQQAYNRGRWSQMRRPAVLKARPYWLYDAIMDSRTSPLCRALDGTLLSADDPFWRTHLPPLHHNCRSAIRTQSKRQARKRGVSQGPPLYPPAGDPFWKKFGAAQERKLAGQPIAADTGFGQAPNDVTDSAPLPPPQNVDPGLMAEYQQKQKSAPSK